MIAIHDAVSNGRQSSQKILDRIKWNSKPPTPLPQIKDEDAQKPKHAIFPALIWGGGGGGGGYKFPIHFVPRLYSTYERSKSAKLLGFSKHLSRLST